MKRTALFALLAGLGLASLSPPTPALAQDVSAQEENARLSFSAIVMRSTNASLVARNPFWPAKTNSVGFLDSTVFRRAASLTAYDTSAAYLTADFPFPPNFGPTVANVSTTDTSSVPWFMIRVKQDTTSAQWATSGMTSASLDSFRVAVEHSYDGVTWFSCPGTPTRRFDTVYMTSGQDGLQSPTLIGVEGSPGEDAGLIQFSCVPSTATTNAFIVNRSLCLTGEWVRFIFGGDVNGQFAPEIGTWANKN